MFFACFYVLCYFFGAPGKHLTFFSGPSKPVTVRFTGKSAKFRNKCRELGLFEIRLSRFSQLFFHSFTNREVEERLRQSDRGVTCPVVPQRLTSALGCGWNRPAVSLTCGTAMWNPMSHCSARKNVPSPLLLRWPSSLKLTVCPTSKPSCFHNHSLLIHASPPNRWSRSKSFSIGTRHTLVPAQPDIMSWYVISLLEKSHDLS